MSNSTIIATSTVTEFSGKKDPNARYGNQICGLKTDLGMFKQFERFLVLSRGDKPLPAGEYEVVPKPAFVDDSGYLRVGFDLVPLKSAVKGS